MKMYLLTCVPNKNSNKLIKRISMIWSLSAWRNFASMAIQNAHSVNCEQTTQMRRLSWIFSGRTYPKVRFLPLRVTRSGGLRFSSWYETVFIGSPLCRQRRPRSCAQLIWAFAVCIRYPLTMSLVITFPFRFLSGLHTRCIFFFFFFFLSFLPRETTFVTFCLLYCMPSHF